MRHIILGTAGHIDHGKTALVKALTGVDPDRLKEEKERGITIDLGFANLLYDDLTVGIVDVPGHEKLIKNMLAGAGGIDVVLVVIAADEGIMPQSREHLAICNLLGIKAGLVAITKTDLVDKEWLDLVKEEVMDFMKGTFLEDSPIIPFSSATGYNLELLKETIREIAVQVKPKSSNGLFRLPVDRVFTIKGFGTVVTGTALSGSVSTDDSIEILPSGRKGKIRGLQSYGRAIQKAYAGQRVAINLQGIERQEIQRGDVVVPVHQFHPTEKIDAKINLLKTSPLVKNRSLLHFYISTSEGIARLILYDQEDLSSGEEAFCQLRLNAPVLALSGDRFIIRRFSPLDTIGGGVVVDPMPPKRKRKDGIEDLEIYDRAGLEEKLLEKIKRSGIKGISIGVLKGWIHEDIPTIDSAIVLLKENGEITQFNETLFHREVIKTVKRKIVGIVSSFHERFPLKNGMRKEELKAHFKVFDPKTFFEILNFIEEMAMEKEIVRLASFKPSLSSIDESIKKGIMSTLKETGFQPPFRTEIARSLSTNERVIEDILRLLIKEGSIVRINDSVYLLRETYDTMIESLRKFSLNKKEITVAEFRDLIKTTRKFALPYLEYLDSNKITLRIGDRRKILL